MVKNMRILKKDEHEPEMTYKEYWKARAFIIEDGGIKQFVEFKDIYFGFGYISIV